MNWAEIVGNVASGGLLGMLSNVVTFGMSWFQRKQAHDFAMAEGELEMKTTRLQAEADAARTAGEVAVARERGAADAFTASQQAEQSIGATYLWVNAVRALTRPGLTVLLLVLTAIIYAYSETGTREFIAQNIVVTSTAAVIWWFGSRQLDKSSMSWGNATAGARIESSQKP